MKPGDRVGDWRLIEPLEQGGAGVVWHAEAAGGAARGRAAVKILRPEVAALPIVADGYLSEARAARLLRHEGRPVVLDLGRTTDGRPFVAMEFLEGASLEEVLSQGETMPPAEVARLVAQIAVALGAEHARGDWHGDLKPRNIVVVPHATRKGESQVKVLGFGTGKLVSRNAPALAALRATKESAQYLAPEQCGAAGSVATDFRVDIYALGIIAYRMLSGRTPFSGRTVEEVYELQRTQPPPPLQSVAPGVPAPVAQVIARALAKEPGARFSSAEELGSAMRAAVAGDVSGSAAGRSASPERRLDLSGSGGLPAVVSAGSWGGLSPAPTGTARAAAAAPRAVDAADDDDLMEAEDDDVEELDDAGDADNHAATDRSRAEHATGATERLAAMKAMASARRAAHAAEEASRPDSGSAESDDDRAASHRRLIAAARARAEMRAAAAAAAPSAGGGFRKFVVASVLIGAGVVAFNILQATDDGDSDSLEEARTAIEARDWDAALEALEEADEDTSESEELFAKVLLEKRAKTAYDGFTAALREGDDASALNHAGGVDRASVYWRDVEPLLPDVKARLSSAALMEARLAMSRGDLDEARKAVEAARTFGGDPDAIAAMEERIAAKTPTEDPGAVDPLGPPGGRALEAKKMLARKRGAFQRCYEKGLVRDPELKGMVKLSIVVLPDGYVDPIETHVIEETLGDGKVVACILKVAIKMRFSEIAAGEGPFTISYPLKFSGGTPGGGGGSRGDDDIIE